jgi:Spy/CpxP family protein refolding chaperone
MNTHRIILSALTIALLALPGAVSAQGYHGGPGGGGPGDGLGPGPGGFFGHGGAHDGFGPEMLLGRLADRLELTDDQRAQIEAIADTCRAQTSDLRDQIEAAWESYRENHEMGAFDETQARAFAETVSGIHAQLMVEHMRAASQAFNVLTPEQQAELKELLDSFDGGFGRHGKGRHCPNRG